MPLQKILFKPGVNRENTRYTNEGGWFECDKVRFRQGTPEVIGGWQQISSNTYSGVCRSLWNWVTLAGDNYIGVGTNVKFYIENGGAYNDITPINSTQLLGADPFLSNGVSTVTVTAVTTGLTVGTYVTFSGVTGTYDTTLNAEFQILSVGASSFTISTSPTIIPAVATGGPTVSANFLVSAGPAAPVPLVGWGAGAWNEPGTTWGLGGSTSSSLRLWSQINYGQDLVFGPRGGGLYYWTASGGTSTRGVLLSSLGGTVTFTNGSPTLVTSTILYSEGAALQFAGPGTLPTGITANTTYYVYGVNGLTFNLFDAAGSIVNTTSTGSGVVSNIVDVPVVQNTLTVSDTSRFIMVFGCNDYGSVTQDPMLIRWSSQDDPYNWTPAVTNQAGSIRLSHGSQIVTTVQTRQEIVVFTDSSVYSMQYLGPPFVWAPQLLGDNISIISQNAAVIASGVIYWMGVDKFYMYDGRVQTLSCDLRRYVFQDLNQDQDLQVFCGTNEGFNEVWWFYCSANSNLIDKYVIYNYFEKVWYYGTMNRTAWLDSGLLAFPVAAPYNSTTATGNLVYHESGINANETGLETAIDAYISSSEFDIGDGHNFGFVWRMLPDLTFQNSSNSPSGEVPKLTMTLYGLSNSGSGATETAGANVSSSASYVITEEFTGQVNTRIRGRQMILKVESNQLNTTWQLGAPRIDIRPDGRR
jgi:hypothetical protein